MCLLMMLKAKFPRDTWKYVFIFTFENGKHNILTVAAWNPVHTSNQPNVTQPSTRWHWVSSLINQSMSSIAHRGIQRESAECQAYPHSLNSSWLNFFLLKIKAWPSVTKITSNIVVSCLLSLLSLIKMFSYVHYLFHYILHMV